VPKISAWGPCSCTRGSCTCSEVRFCLKEWCFNTWGEFTRRTWTSHPLGGHLRLTTSSSQPCPIIAVSSNPQFGEKHLICGGGGTSVVMFVLCEAVQYLSKTTSPENCSIRKSGHLFTWKFGMCAICFDMICMSCPPGPGHAPSHSYQLRLHFELPGGDPGSTLFCPSAARSKTKPM
jgi:hypothetical protein